MRETSNILPNCCFLLGIHKTFTRALAMKSEVILFDEPTSSLDPELVGEVLAVIQNLSHEGMTMVIATHEMKFAEEVANRVMFLDQGRIVESNEAKTFFTQPKTARARQFLERYMRMGAI